jgi:hypothetical protein
MKVESGIIAILGVTAFILVIGIKFTIEIVKGGYTW